MPWGEGRFLGYAVGRECLVEDTSFIATSGRETDTGESAIDGVLQGCGKDWERMSAKAWGEGM
jgi:hypothetical protein